jgi:4-hydroxy-3-polyprenylbenzoate decarboxylase
MIFDRVTGFDMPVVAGVLASRERAALLLGSTVKRLPFDLLEAQARPLAPITVQSAPCHDVVIRPPFDIRRLLPAPTHTPQDAGPYVTMGLVRARDPETGESDVTILRLCLHGPDTLSIYFAPGRRIDRFRDKAERMGRSLPVSIAIGLDPAVYLGACCAAPPGFDELSVAGALRGRPVSLVDCVSVPLQAPAHAEIVIEGEILPGVRVREDAPSHSGSAMPEFHGYMGVAQPDTPVVRVTAVTHRRNPMFQTIVGPALERANLIGIPTEAAVLRFAAEQAPGLLANAYAHPAGGGSLLMVLQIAEDSLAAQGAPRETARAVLSAFPGVKHLVLVDEDVDLFDSDDLLWAITTRCGGPADIVFHPGPELRFPVAASRIFMDCTVPPSLRDRFQRPKFARVDLKDYPLKSK